MDSVDKMHGEKIEKKSLLNTVDIVIFACLHFR